MLWKLDLPRESEPLQHADEPPTGIGLIPGQAEPGGFREGVMVVVPSFAHRQQTKPRHVVALHGRSLDHPTHRAVIVSDVSHGPMSDERGHDANADSRHTPFPAADEKQQHRQWKLGRHPVAIEPAIISRLGDGWFRAKRRWMDEPAFAVQIPQGIQQHSAFVDEEWMALRLSLAPITKLVERGHPPWSTHADERSGSDQDVLQPERTSKAAVDPQPVHSHRVSAAQRDHRQHARDDRRIPTESPRLRNGGDEEMGGEPKRLGWRPDDLTVQGIALTSADHAFGSQHGLSFAAWHMEFVGVLSAKWSAALTANSGKVASVGENSLGSARFCGLANCADSVSQRSGVGNFVGSERSGRLRQA